MRIRGWSKRRRGGDADDDHGDPRSRLLGSCVALLIASGVLFVVAIVVAPASNSLLYEGAKVLPQVGLVSVAGAVLGMLAFDYQQAHLDAEKVRQETQEKGVRKRERKRMAEEKERDHERERAEKERDEARELAEKRLARDAEARALREELLKGTLARATASYSAAKSARRLLRALALSAPGHDGATVRAGPYDTHMATIIEAQLQFEALVQDVRTSRSAFSRADAVAAEFDLIEKRLHLVIAEYETERPRFSDDGYRPLDALPALGRFLTRHADDPATFREGFMPISEGLDRARHAIRADLLGESSP